MTRIAIGATILILLIFAAIRRAPETYPWGDTAATSIYTLRAATGDLSVGSYSRFQWNHPGPLLYQVLAPLYAMSGYREISIKWTAWLLNMTALTALILIVWRRAPMLAVTVAIALMPLIYREQRLLFWAWNPILPLLPLALAVAVSSGVAAGRVALLPWLVLVTSFLVQSHVAFVPVTAVLLVTSVVVWVWRGRPIDESRPRRHLLIATLVFIAVWAVPILNELGSRRGNLSAIASFFLTTPDEARSWSTVLTVFTNQLVGPLVPSWELTTAEASEVVSWPVLVFAGLQFPLLLFAAIKASRRGASFEAAFAGICFAVSLTGVFAVRSIVGPISDYLITWVAVIGALNLAVIAAEALPSLRQSIERIRRPSALALVTYLAVIGIVGIARLTSKHSFDARSTVIRTLTERLDGYCREHGIERPVLRFSGAGWEGASGILLQYYKQRRPIAVPDDLRYLVGEPFAASGRETAEFYLMLGTENEIPPGVTRHEWLLTHGSFRLIRLFR